MENNNYSDDILVNVSYKGVNWNDLDVIGKSEVVRQLCNRLLALECDSQFMAIHGKTDIKHVKRDALTKKYNAMREKYLEVAEALQEVRIELERGLSYLAIVEKEIKNGLDRVLK